MNVEQPLQRPSRQARAEASAWIAKLHGPERCAELERDFRVWLDADAEHARAFEHVTEIWDAIGHVNTGGLPRLGAADTFEPRRRERRWLPAAVAACGLLVVAAVAWLAFSTRSYETQIGEQRIVTLEDGSRLYLNSDTQLEVALDAHARRIELERGEAFFEVARDERRPFIVTAGDRRVTALGTAFAVRLQANQVAVTLLEGKVSVTPAEPGQATVLASKPQVAAGESAASSDGLVLKPGERVIVSDSGSAVIDTPRTDATAAWRRGEIVLDETSLDAAVAELNRYQRQRLVIDDAALAPLPVSGIYRIGNNQDFADAVALLYHLDVIAADEEIHLRRKR
jgi:transmembrane sensor